MSVEAQRDKLHADADEAIEWLPGSTPDLTEREQMLVANARREGYADGERYGYKIGGEEAIRLMTRLNARVSAQEVVHAIRTLAYFTDGLYGKDDG